MEGRRALPQDFRNSTLESTQGHREAGMEKGPWVLAVVPIAALRGGAAAPCHRRCRGRSAGRGLREVAAGAGSTLLGDSCGCVSRGGQRPEVHNQHRLILVCVLTLGASRARMMEPHLESRQRQGPSDGFSNWFG